MEGILTVRRQIRWHFDACVSGDAMSVSGAKRFPLSIPIYCQQRHQTSNPIIADRKKEREREKRQTYQLLNTLNLPLRNSQLLLQLRNIHICLPQILQLVLRLLKPRTDILNLLLQPLVLLLQLLNSPRLLPVYLLHSLPIRTKRRQRRRLQRRRRGRSRSTALRNRRLPERRRAHLRLDRQRGLPCMPGPRGL